MEMFNAGDQQQWNVICRTIDDCDYYVVIIGLRYGSMADGVSYTEKEYDYAVSRGIPVLTFIKDENTSSTPIQRESCPDKTAKLNDFREKAKGKMARFWKTTGDLTTALSTSLQSEFKTNPRTGWIRATFDPCIMSEELAELSRENRELRKLAEAASTRKPVLEFELELEGGTPLNFSSPHTKHRREISSEWLSYDHRLSEAISDDVIAQYNAALPSQEDYDVYNAKAVLYWHITENKHKASIRIKNSGTNVAKQVTVKLRFPPEIWVFDDCDIDQAQKPDRLQIPQNPIDQYLEKRNKANLGILKAAHGVHLQKFTAAGIFDKFRYPMHPGLRGPRDYSTRDKDFLCHRAGDLLHTNTRSSDYFYVVTTKRGTYEIEGSIICEELSEPITQVFTVVVE